MAGKNDRHAPLAWTLAACAAFVGSLWAWLEPSRAHSVAAAELLPQPVVPTESEPRSAAVLESESTPARALNPVMIGATAPEETEPEPQPVTEAQLQAWIEDLRDDDRNWNAVRAASHLWIHFRQAKPLLLQALDSTDAQQRSLAAYVLTDRPLDEPRQMHRLVWVLAESFENPQYFPRKVSGADGERECQLSVDLATNAAIAFQTFPEYRALALPAIERVWQREDDDHGRRAGYILAHDARGRLRYAVAQRAVEHLVDNEIDGDAVISLRTLTRLGPEALGVVFDALPGRDQQQQALLGHWLSYFSPDHRQARRLTARHWGRMGFSYGDWVLAEWERMDLPSVPHFDVPAADLPADLPLADENASEEDG